MAAEKDDEQSVWLADDMDAGSCTMDDELKVVTVGRGKARTLSFQVFVTKVKGFFKSAYKICSSFIGLLLLLIIYSFIGAFIIQAVELPHEQAEHVLMLEKRNVIVSSFGNLSTQHVNGKINQTVLEGKMTELLIRYEEDLGINSQSKWTFWGSLFYCGTVYTTIGYGHTVPATTAGRVVTMVYATFGIPLALIVLADMGKKMMVGIKFLWSLLRRFTKKKRTKPRKQLARSENDSVEKNNVRPVISDNVENLNEVPPNADAYEGEDEHVDEEFSLPFIVAIIIVVIYIILGSFMYLLWETKWNFFSSFYFIFISISTIGFGDVIPEHPKYFLLSSIYIFIGLSLVSMCINVAIEVFTKTISKAKEKIEGVGKTLDRAKDSGLEKMQSASDKLNRVKMKMTLFSRNGNTDSVES